MKGQSQARQHPSHSAKSQRFPRPRAAFRQLALERLEDRVVLDADLGGLRFLVPFNPAGTYVVTGSTTFGFKPVGSEAFKPLGVIQGTLSFNTNQPATFMISGGEIDASVQGSSLLALWKGSGTFDVNRLVTTGFSVTGGQGIQVAGSNTLSISSIVLTHSSSTTADSQIKVQGSLSIPSLVGLNVAVDQSNYVIVDSTGVSLTGVNASINGAFSAGGLNVTPTNLGIAYRSANNQFAVYGSLSASSSSMSFSGSLGTSTDPGLVIENGALTRVHVTLTNGFQAGGASFTAQNLALDYSKVNGNEIYAMGAGAVTLTAGSGNKQVTLTGSLGAAGNPGLKIVNGVLTDLNVAITGNLRVGNTNAVSLSANGLTFSYARADSSFAIATGSVTLTAGNGNQQLMLSGNFGAAGKPGLKIVNGVLTDVNVAISGDIMVGGINGTAVTATGLTLTYSSNIANDSVFAITAGSATFKAGKIGSSNYLEAKGTFVSQGLKVVNGALTNLNVAIDADIVLGGANGVAVNAAGLTIAYNTETVNNVTNTVFGITSGSATFKVGKIGSSNYLEAKGTFVSQGLKVVDGALTNLNVAIDADIVLGGANGVAVNAAGLTIAYSTETTNNVTNTVFGITSGSAAFKVGKIGSSNYLEAKGTFVSQGLKVVNGALTNLNVAIDADIVLGGANGVAVNAAGLTIAYSTETTNNVTNTVFGITSGSAAFKVGKIGSSNYLEAKGTFVSQGLKVVDGALTNLNVAIDADIVLGGANGVAVNAAGLTIAYSTETVNNVTNTVFGITSGSATFKVGKIGSSNYLEAKGTFVSQGLKVVDGALTNLNVAIDADIVLGGANGVAVNAAGLTIAYSTETTNNVTNTVFGITSGSAAFKVGKIGSSNYLEAKGTFGAQGLKVVNGALTNLNVTIDADITLGGVNGVKVTSTGLTIVYSNVGNETSFGISNGEVTFKVGTNQNRLEAKAKFGNEGLKIVNGELRSLNVTVATDIKLGGDKGFSLKVKDLPIRYKNDNGSSLFQITGGTVRVGIGSGSSRVNFSGDFGSESNPGLVIMDGALKSLNIAITADVKIAGLEAKVPASNPIHFEYQAGDTPSYMISGSVIFMKPFKATVTLGTEQSKGLIIRDGALQTFDITLSDAKLGSFTIESLRVQYTKTDTSFDLKASANVVFPAGWKVGGSISFVDGRLSSFLLSYDAKPNQPGIQIGGGFNIQHMAASVENIDQPANLVVKGGLVVVWGASFQLFGKNVTPFIAAGSFQVDKNSLVLRAQAMMCAVYTPDYSDPTNPKLTSSFDLGNGKGTLDFNWSKGIYKANVDMNLYYGFFHVQGSFAFSEEGDLAILASLELQIPPAVPIIGGTKIGGISFAFILQTRPTRTSGVFAAWLSIPIVGDVGFQLEFQDGTTGTNDTSIPNTSGPALKFDLLGNEGVANIRGRALSLTGGAPPTVNEPGFRFHLGEPLPVPADATAIVVQATGVKSRGIGVGIIDTTSNILFLNDTTAFDSLGQTPLTYVGRFVPVGNFRLVGFSAAGITTVPDLTKETEVGLRFTGKGEYSPSNSHTYRPFLFYRYDPAETPPRVPPIYTATYVYAAPTVRVDSVTPAPGSSVVSVSLRETASPALRNTTTLSLYYNTTEKGLAGATLIAGDLPYPGESTSIPWDTTGLAVQPYYLYAVIDDGQNPIVTSLPSSPFRPTPPLQGKVTDLISRQALSGVKVFLDINGNNEVDGEEPTTITTDEGTYAFYRPQSTFANNVPTGTVGNRFIAGTLGMPFTVVRPITITHLGVFDGGNLTQTLRAAIFSDDSISPNRLAELTFNPGDPQLIRSGSSVYLPLATPLQLPAGFRGVSTAWGYSVVQPFGDAGDNVRPTWTTDDGGGAVSFTGFARYNLTFFAGQFPNVSSGKYANQYAAGSFQFVESRFDALRVLTQLSVGVVAPDGFGPSASVVVPWNTNVPQTANFKLQQLASISGVFYQDLNKNGIQDSGERFLPGQQAYLDLNNNNRRDLDEPLATTDNAGRYTFYNMSLGATYTVRPIVDEDTIQTGSFTAIQTPAGSPNGTFQLAAWGGSLGVDFDVNQDILITQLGAYNGGKARPASTLRVSIFNRDTQTEVDHRFLDPLDSRLRTEGGSVFLSIGENPIHLPAGFHGTIVTSGYQNSTGTGAGELYGVSEDISATAQSPWVISDTGGLITILPDQRKGPENQPGAFPTSSTSTLVLSREESVVDVPFNIDGFVASPPVPGLNTNDVAVSWTADLHIHAAGTYTFYSRSDDGSLLYIDGTLVVKNDGLHANEDGISTPILLSEGSHTFLLKYFQRGGAGAVRAEFSGPGTGNVRTLIPADAFHHLTASYYNLSFSPNSVHDAFRAPFAAGTFQFQADPATTAYDVTDGTPGNESWAGSLGMDFTVKNTPIQVTQLGVFAPNDFGTGSGNTLYAAIFNRDTQAKLAQIEFKQGAAGLKRVGQNWFLPLAQPLSLPAGFKGRIVAWGYKGNGATSTSNIQFGDSYSSIPTAWKMSGGGLVEFDGTNSWYGPQSQPGVYPANRDQAVPNEYAAGTFQFVANRSVSPPPSALTAIAVPGTVVATERWGGSLGNDFDVLADISVTDLGVTLNPGQGSTLQSTLYATIFNRDTQLPVLPQPLVFTPGDARMQLQGNNLFLPLPSTLHLPAGFHGCIVAWGYASKRATFNLNGDLYAEDFSSTGPLWTLTSSGLVQFQSSTLFSRYSDEDQGGQYPLREDGKSGRYAAGTFRFVAEPTTSAYSQPVYTPQNFTVSPVWSPKSIASLVLSRPDPYPSSASRDGTIFQAALRDVFAGGRVSGLNNDNVGVAWSGTLNIATGGSYTFYSKSDDGSLLFIDGVQVVNNDGLHEYRDGTSTPITLSAGAHTFLELYIQKNGGSRLDVSYQGPDTNNARIIIPQGKFSQLTGSYYNLTTSPSKVTDAFNLPAKPSAVTTRAETSVNAVTTSTGFSSNGTAVPGVSNTNVVIAWRGLVTIRQAGTYTFYSNSDDGSLLYIDGIQVVNNNGLHGPQDGTSTPIKLSAGPHSFLELYYQAGGGGRVSVEYSGPDTNNVRTLVTAFPQLTATYYNVGGAPSNTIPALSAVPTSSWGGSLGQAFNVQSDTLITALGAYANGRSAADLKGPLHVAIFNRDDTRSPKKSVVELTFNPNDASLRQDGGYLYQNLPQALHLPAGFKGMIVTWGYATSNNPMGAEPYGTGLFSETSNVFSGGGLISTQGSFYGEEANPGIYPTQPKSGSVSAGTFQFVADRTALALPTLRNATVSFGTTDTFKQAAGPNFGFLQRRYITVPFNGASQASSNRVQALGSEYPSHEDPTFTFILLQNGSHAHSVTASPNETFVGFPDLEPGTYTLRTVAPPSTIDATPDEVHPGFSVPLLTDLLGSSPYQALSLTTGDFNQDGQLEMAALVRQDDVTSLLVARYRRKENPDAEGPRSGATGTMDFQLVSLTPLPNGETPLKVVSLDRTGQGRLDLAVLYASGRVDAFVNQGHLSFIQAPHIFELSQVNNRALSPGDVQIVDLLARDLNKDGKDDLIVTYNSSDGRSAGFVASLTGTETATAWDLPLPVGGLAAGDLGSDGSLDLVFNEGMEFTVATFQGQSGSDATFDLLQYRTPLSGLGGPVTLADLNADGKLDVVLQTADGQLGYFHPYPGGFSPVILGNLPESGLASGLVQGRFSGNSQRDLLVLGRGSLELFSTRGVRTADGNIVAQTSLKADAVPLHFPVPEGLTSVTAADLDGDGGHDLLVTSAEGIYIIYNRPTTSAPSVVVGPDEDSVLTVTFKGADQLFGFAYEDSNGNGRFDPGEPQLQNTVFYANFDRVGHYVDGDPTFSTDATGVYNLGYPGPDDPTDSDNERGTLTVGILTPPPGYHLTSPADITRQLLPTSHLQVDFAFARNVLADTITVPAATQQTAMTMPLPMAEEVSHEALFYQLGAGAPEGASVDPRTGLFTFAPADDMPFGSYPVTVQVKDLLDPMRTDQRTFLLTVTPTPNQYSIMNLYQEILGRTPETEGLKYWAASLDGGALNQTQIAEGIQQSVEARHRQVGRLYQSLLGRTADDNGLTFWTDYLNNGNSIQDLKVKILGTTEFYAHSGGTTEGFLNGLYQKGLGRGIDPVGESYFGSRLAATNDRDQIAAEVLSSREGHTQSVQELYQDILGRSGDDAGIDFWVSTLEAGRRIEDIMVMFYASEEFLKR